MTIQKLFRRFSVRLRMARWVAEEDDDDVALAAGKRAGRGRAVLSGEPRGL